MRHGRLLLALWCASLGAAPVTILNNSSHAATFIETGVNAVSTGQWGVTIVGDMTDLDTMFDPTLIADSQDTSRTNYNIDTQATRNSAPYTVLANPWTGYAFSIESQNYAALLSDQIVNVWAYEAVLSSGTPPPTMSSTISVLSTGPGVEFGMSANYLGLNTGTNSSVSTAFAGLLAVLKVNHPTWNWQDIKAALRETSSNWSTGYNPAAYGYGSINWSAANSASTLYLQPPLLLLVSNQGYQAQFVLLPYRQTRRVREIVESVPASYVWPVKNEYTAADLAAAGGTVIYTSNGTDVEPTFIYGPAVSGTITLAYFTTDGAGNYSRVESFTLTAVSFTVGVACN